MNKPKLAISLLFALITTNALAGPKSFSQAEEGVTEAGRAYQMQTVDCGTREGEFAVYKFEGSKKWCLEDESYCSSNKIKVAKKVCRAKS